METRKAGFFMSRIGIATVIGGVAALAVTVVMLIGAYSMPVKLLKISPDEIASVTISSGAQIAVTDKDKIKSLVSCLESMEFRRTKLSGIGGRQQCLLRFYGADGGFLQSISICDEETVDNGRFFCKTNAGEKINLKYLQTFDQF